MGLQKRLSIYVGYESKKLVRYLEPSAGDLLTARFAECHFDETIFPSFEGDRNGRVTQKRLELSWSLPTLSHLDPQILDLQYVSESMPDTFIDILKVTRSYILATNMPAKLEIPYRDEGPTLSVQDKAPRKPPMVGPGIRPPIVEEHPEASSSEE